MPRAKKVIGLPSPRTLRSNQLRDLQNHLRLMNEAMNSMYKLLLSDMLTIEVGTGTGDNWLYFGGKNKTGSARIGLDGTKWVVQHYISGTYTERFASNP